MTSKLSVEECCALSMKTLKRALKKGAGSSGSTTWESGYGASVLVFQVIEHAGWLAIQTAFSTESGKNCTQLITLCVSEARYGDRTWLACRCGNRCYMLYRPHFREHFACRECHDLAYLSQQGHVSQWLSAHAREQTIAHDQATPQTPLRRREKLEEEYQAMEQRKVELSPRPPMLPPVHQTITERLQSISQRHQAQPEPKHRPMPKPVRPVGRPRQKRSYVRRKPLTLTERTSERQAYCPKCRDRRDMLDGQQITMTNGRPAIQGRCALCQTVMTCIVKREG